MIKKKKKHTHLSIYTAKTERERAQRSSRQKLWWCSHASDDGHELPLMNDLLVPPCAVSDELNG
jgi:hypothetical protein